MSLSYKGAFRCLWFMELGTCDCQQFSSNNATCSDQWMISARGKLHLSYFKASGVLICAAQKVIARKVCTCEGELAS